MASSSAPELRASDAEREVVVERLRDHAAAGRLSADELEQRVAAALAARTTAELGRLEDDLPRASSPRAGGGRRAEWRAHLTAYLAVNLMLIAIWAVTGAGYFWPVWPLLGWGVGLALDRGCGGKSHHCRARRSPRQGGDEVWI